MPTKEEFNRYITVQISGRYNMITEAWEAAEEANLPIYKYLQIMKNYSYLSEKYGN